MFLGMSNGVMWISFIFVSLFQVYLFWQGIDLIKRFLNFAGPAVYIVMIFLMLANLGLKLAEDFYQKLEKYFLVEHVQVDLKV